MAVGLNFLLPLFHSACKFLSTQATGDAAVSAASAPAVVWENRRSAMRYARSVGAMAVCACFAMMIAATVKFNAFLPAGRGICDNASVDGMATLKYFPDTESTRLHLSVADLEPNTQYSVMVDNTATGAGILGPVSQLRAFTTNPQGHGVFQTDVFFQGNLTVGEPRITIFIWDGVEEEGIPLHTDSRDQLDEFCQTRAEAVLF